jgi:rhodanese-related sulfurtransferase
MAPNHAPRFLKIVDEARSRVRETNVDEVKKRLDSGDRFELIDVREESEYAADHLPGAVHLGKGIIERDVEARYPDPKTELVLYCGGGFRSALAADNLQKMGYTNVISVDGGIRDWKKRGYPLER